MERSGIIMQGILNATDVRKNWGKFIDNVVREKPSVVKRNRDYFAAVSLEHLQHLLNIYRFNLEYEKEDDGSFSGYLKELDIVANAATLDALKEKLAKELIEYAEEYMSEFEMYYHASNRKSHFPYLLNVLVQSDTKKVEELINA